MRPQRRPLSTSADHKRPTALAIRKSIWGPALGVGGRTPAPNDSPRKGGYVRRSMARRGRGSGGATTGWAGDQMCVGHHFRSTNRPNPVALAASAQTSSAARCSLTRPVLPRNQPRSIQRRRTQRKIGTCKYIAERPDLSGGTYALRIRSPARDIEFDIMQSTSEAGRQCNPIAGPDVLVGYGAGLALPEG